MATNGIENPIPHDFSKEIQGQTTRIVQPTPHVERLMRAVTGGDPDKEKAIIERSARFKPAHLAWLLVKHQRATDAMNGRIVYDQSGPLTQSGFAGYFVGMDAEESIERQVAIGNRINRSIINYVNYLGGSYSTKWNIREMLHGRIHGQDIRSEMSLFDEVLAMSLAIARGQATDESEAFRTTTYSQLGEGHDIQTIDGHNTQIVLLPALKPEITHIVPVPLTKEQYPGYVTATLIGKFGNPLFRSAMEFSSQN